MSSAAPVLIVVCGDTSRCVPAVLEASVWPAVQNLLLAAATSGLGSALTTLATVFGDELRQVLALPEHVRAMAVVPLGHPAVKLGPPKRLPAFPSAPTANATELPGDNRRESRMTKPGPLLAADELLSHQIVDTFARVGQSDRSWTEKIWAMAASAGRIAQRGVRVGQVHQSQRHGRVRRSVPGH